METQDLMLLGVLGVIIYLVHTVMTLQDKFTLYETRAQKQSQSSKEADSDSESESESKTKKDKRTVAKKKAKRKLRIVQNYTGPQGNDNVRVGVGVELNPFSALTGGGFGGAIAAGLQGLLGNNRKQLPR